MTTRIACLPMYDFPHLRGAHDALWSALAARLDRAGVRDVPRALDTSVPYRDGWRDPRLLFGQACEYPLMIGYAEALTIIATPRYRAPGCGGTDYRSAIVVRAGETARALAELRDRRCVINDWESNSGMNLLRAAIAPIAGGTRFFRAVETSGSHWNSARSVAAGDADVAAIDCVTWAHLALADAPLHAALRVLAWTPAASSLPLVTAVRTDEDTVSALRQALADVAADPASRPFLSALLIEGFDTVPDASLAKTRALARSAADSGYPDLR